MDGVCKCNLKPDSIPTIFSHAKPLKRRALSIQRENDRDKKALLEETISEQLITNEPASDTALVSVKNTPEKSFNLIDKAIDCTPQVKDVKTQYSLSHCYHNHSKEASC